MISGTHHRGPIVPLSLYCVQFVSLSPTPILLVERGGLSSLTSCPNGRHAKEGDEASARKEIEIEWKRKTTSAEWGYLSGSPTTKLSTERVDEHAYCSTFNGDGCNFPC